MNSPTFCDRNAINLNALIARGDADFSSLRMNNAADSYRKILALNPHDVHALHRMGLVCVHNNEIAEAGTYLDLALKVTPDRADLWEHAGLIATMKGEYLRAEAFYRRALSLSGSTATLHRNLADCLQLCGRHAEAKVQYKQAISIEPDLHHAIRAVARISAELGEADDAANYWLRALMLNPSSLQDGLDTVDALAKVKRAELLDNVVAQIRSQWAADADALEALCLALYRVDRFADMLSVARQGLDINPQRTILHRYAAHALSVRGNIAEAIIHSREAVRLTPADPINQIQLACLELSNGKFRNGWARHNIFYTTPLARTTRVFPNFPVWNGESVVGCRFLLVGEQGRGDEIQLIRFAAWLQRQGAIVDVMVSQPIAGIAASMTGIRSVLTSMPAGPYEYWSHMLRMPAHMKLELEMLPIIMPYIAASPDKIEYWKAHVNAVSALAEPTIDRRIGIVWAGGSYSALDRFRSISIEAFKPLFSHPGTAWFSIQKGERERESEALSDEFNLHTLGPAIEDFTDTLAILETLDLLITVDTSVAHLAGAANLPVWVLVPAYSEWRWLAGRTDTPWYPSMRLFRQRELGEWGAVIEEVRNALQEWYGAEDRKNGDIHLIPYPLSEANLSSALKTITMLEKSGRSREVDDLVTQICARFSADGTALRELAYTLNCCHRFKDAIVVAKQGLAIDPRNAWLHLNALYAFNILGDFSSARWHSIEAAKLAPHEPVMQFNLAVSQLRFGDFKNGWSQYRWRERLPENHDLARLTSPEWEGESVAGCRFLLIGEQGLGDQIQFLRMADWLHRQGATVDVWVAPLLVEIARNAKGVRSSWAVRPPVNYDYWCRMLGMPERMGLELSMLPVAASYLGMEATAVSRWTQRLYAQDVTCEAGTRQKRVGLVWSGNPAYELDRYRSISLNKLRPILAGSGLKWYSLQKGDAERDAETLLADIDIQLLGSEINDFADTVAILQTLDLVITVDTSVAHLAGAVGVPVWVMLPTYVDWRWMTERTDSPWYLSMRLFRQRELDEWTPVIEEVRDALREWRNI